MAVGARSAFGCAAAVVAVGAAPAAGGCALTPDDDPASERRERAVVVAIADGDTIEVRRGGETADVRLVGIDAPESSSLRYGAPDCAGERAKASMEELLEPGTRVTLAPDPSQDRRDQYGRLLRYVERDGADVGRLQVERGLADVYVYDPDAPPQRTGAYRRAEAAAREAGRGVNALCGGDFHRSRG